MEDKTGINIRYMVESARLNNDFFTNLAEPEKSEEILDSEEDFEDSLEDVSETSEETGPYSDAK